MSLPEKVLAHLQTVAEEATDMLDTMFSSYPESRRKMWRSIKHGPKPFEKDWAEWYRGRQHLYTTLYRLRKDGLIRAEKTEDNRNSFWAITQKGRDRLRRLRKRKPNPLTAQQMNKTLQKNPSLVLIMFDIPEHHKQKRYWLRAALKELGFQFLQKSVWLGKQGVPKDLIDGLQKHKMLSYVHILAISKKGTLHPIQ